MSGDCVSNWKKATEKSSKIASTADAIERNKCISASYADMALKDPVKYRWAGAAAFVSVNGGAAMRVAKANTNLWKYGLGGHLARDNSLLMLDTLGRINNTIFSDIYPALTYFEEFGLESLEACSFQNPDGYIVPRDLINALKLIETGKVAEGSLMFAQYEQGLVQTAYNDKKVIQAMSDLESYYKSESWLGRRRDSAMLTIANAFGIETMAPEIVMGADPSSGAPVPMDGSLLVLKDRIKYYEKLEKIYSDRIKEEAHPPAHNALISQLETIRNGCKAFAK